MTLPILSHQIPNDFLWVAGAGFVLSCGEARSQCSHSLAFPTSAPTVNMGIAWFSFHGLFPEQRHSWVCAQEVFPSQSWWHPCLGKGKAFLGRSCAPQQPGWSREVPMGHLLAVGAQAGRILWFTFTFPTCRSFWVEVCGVYWKLFLLLQDSNDEW